MTTRIPASDTTATIHRFARELKAPRIASIHATIAEQARAESWAHEEYLAAVLSVEATARAESGVAQRVKRAGVPSMKTLADFDFTAQPGIDRAEIARLEIGAWVVTAENVVLFGPPGTGKTYRATALGVTAAQRCYRVLFETAAGCVNTLTEAHTMGKLEPTLKRLSGWHLLIIYELGYIPVEADAANLFFQLVSRRYEHGWIVVTSNLAFSNERNVSVPSPSPPPWLTVLSTTPKSPNTAAPATASKEGKSPQQPPPCNHIRHNNQRPHWATFRKAPVGYISKSAHRAPLACNDDHAADELLA